MRDIVSPLAGFSSPFGQRRGFSPVTLFAGGEEGVWYDPSDLTTLFQDTAGTTPVTTPGQTVALMLDQSGNDYHATQSTAAARPKYGIVPETGRRNLLRYTEQFDNAAWSKNAVSTTADAAVAPNGSTTADLVSALSDGSFRYARQFFSLVPATYTFQIAVKSNGTAQWIWLLGETNSNTFFWFDIVNGVIGGSGTSSGGAISGQVYSHSIEDLGDGWYLCKATFAKTSATAGEEIGFGFANASASISATAGQSCLVWGAQLEEGSTATAYQRVTTDLDVTEAGVPSLGYLSFDGVDDVLISPNAIFFGDASSMMVGVETFASPGKRTVGTNVASTGLLVLVGPSQTIGFVNNFTSGTGAVGYNAVSSNNRVFSWLRSQPQNSALLRVDGTGVASTTHDQADNNSRQLAVGGNTTGSFGSMNFFSLVHIARFINEAELSRTETYIAKKTGVTL